MWLVSSVPTLAFKYKAPCSTASQDEACVVTDFFLMRIRAVEHYEGALQSSPLLYDGKKR